MSLKVELELELDETIHPDVIPVYDRMKAVAISSTPHPTKVLQRDGRIIVADHAHINGRKVTCCLYLTPPGGGLRNTMTEEQFEYYTYHYHHIKAL